MTRAPALLDLAADRPDWRALAECAIEQNPLLSPSFLNPALDHLASGRVRLAAVRRDGELAAFAPVRKVRIGRLIPAMAVWAHPYAPLGTPLLASEAAAADLIQAMDDGRQKLLAFPFLPLEGLAAAAIRAAAEAAGRPVAVIAEHRRALLDRDEAPDGDVRGALASRKRKDYERQFRRLAELGSLTVEELRGEPLVEAIDAFLALEASGWKGSGGTALASKPADAAFARAALAAGAQDGSASLTAIRIDGHPIAMLANWTAGDTAVTWKIGYDESLARLSPGVQIMLRTPPLLFADPAVRRIDSLAAPDHPMIDHLWRGRLSVGTLLIAPRGGAHLLSVARALDDLESRAKRRVRSALTGLARRRRTAR